MSKKNDKYAKPEVETRHPAALGKYVDLRVINGLSTEKASEFINEVYGTAAASWCVRACGDRMPRSD